MASVSPKISWAYRIFQLNMVPSTLWSLILLCLAGARISAVTAITGFAIGAPIGSQCLGQRQKPRDDAGIKAAKNRAVLNGPRS